MSHPNAQNYAVLLVDLTQLTPDQQLDLVNQNATSFCGMYDDDRDFTDDLQEGFLRTEECKQRIREDDFSGEEELCLCL